MLTTKEPRAKRKMARLSVAAGQKVVDPNAAIAALMETTGSNGYSAQIKAVIHRKMANAEKYFFIAVTNQDGSEVPSSLIHSITGNVNNDLKEKGTQARIRWVPSQKQFICVPLEVYKQYCRTYENNKA